jgi:hypothetical protein
MPGSIMQDHRDIVARLNEHPEIVRFAHNWDRNIITYKVADAICAAHCRLGVYRKQSHPEIEGGIKHCTSCAAVFATVLPSRETFLQRREFAGRDYVVYKGRISCLMCYMTGSSAYMGLAEVTAGICGPCSRRLARDESRFVRICLLCRELVGRDCVRIVVHYLLNFFERTMESRLAKNE